MQTTKKQLRARFEQRRSARSARVRQQAALDLAAWVAAAPFRLEYDVTVAAYVPFGTEPGSTAILDALGDRGVIVLLPVVGEGAPRRMNWVRYDGPDSLVEGRWGLSEPTGEQLGEDAIEAASLILVPAYAVDATGTRLGRGAGYYDRTLPGATAPIVAVVYDDEVLDDALPADEHDVRVGWVLTPEGGFRELGR
ncbi:5-formyltetrahydrofolate cyclo-ligase [Gordonia sp. CPCC 206044]|uniref:5-formyltetrahydrofolate cyclo-ligase n=1 Tax=Gordonia sp. CPCC 206044 TaxID=3140793 RepID=UPI003AF36BD1